MSNELSSAMRLKAEKQRTGRMVWPFFVAMALCSGAAHGVSLRATAKNLSALMETYYQSPNPNSIASFIEALGPSGVLKNSAAGPPTVGFFSEVFIMNPKMMAVWMPVIEKQDPATRDLLELAASIAKKGGPLTVHSDNPSVNDLYWGAFFASGDKRFIDRLVSELKLCDNRSNLARFMLGASAKWSLASNATMYPIVKLALLKDELTADPRTRQLIKECLAENPDAIRKWTTQILKAQHAAGKW